MRSWKRATAGYVLLLVATFLGFAALYRWGMGTFEGESRTYLESLQFVVETFTATGYGSESPWYAPEMQVMVILIDLTGTLMFFLALPVFVLPLLRETLQQRVPTTVRRGTSDHVVIASDSPRVEPLIAELDSWGVEHAVLEPDRERARARYEDGESVVHADPDEIAGLEAANLGEARALVVDVEDRRDASIVLTAREVDEDVRVVSVVEESDRARYHRLAGADAVVSPRPLLGERLAGMVTSAVTTDLGDAVELGEDFHVVELPVPRESDLVGRTVAESGLRERAGVNVIGAWFRGEFESPPDADAEIVDGTVLLVAGHGDAIDRLAELSAGTLLTHRAGETIVVGHGQVGRAVTDRLDAADLPYTVLDHRDGPNVDVVGGATDPDALRRAGVETARSLVLAVPDDAETEFATLVARDLSDSINVAARADDAGSVRKLYRAGADYVLSLDRVTGRLLASTVLEGEDVLSSDTQVEVVRVAAGDLAGKTLEEAAVRKETGCTVIAVERSSTSPGSQARQDASERGDELLTDLDPDFRFEPDDDLIVAGTDDGINRFTERYE